MGLWDFGIGIKCLDIYIYIYIHIYIYTYTYRYTWIVEYFDLIILWLQDTILPYCLTHDFNRGLSRPDIKGFCVGTSWILNGIYFDVYCLIYPKLREHTIYCGILISYQNYDVDLGRFDFFIFHQCIFWFFLEIRRLSRNVCNQIMPDILIRCEHFGYGMLFSTKEPQNE